MLCSRSVSCLSLFLPAIVSTQSTPKVVATKNLGTHVTTVLSKEKYLEAWLMNLDDLRLFPSHVHVKSLLGCPKF